MKESEQLEEVCKDLGITILCVRGGEIPEGWSRDAQAWFVTLEFEGRKLTCPFYQGSGHVQRLPGGRTVEKAPSAADVLSCLCSDARAGEQSFEDFAGDMGLDVDSRKAEATWRACQAMGPKVRKLLGAAFDRVSAAEH